MSVRSRWSVVLAGGRGTRLASLTTVAGETVPKQYFALAGGPSMLRRAVRRAAAVSGQERLLVVVTAEQRRWWEPELADLPAENVIVQPADRGTAAGILLPLAEVLRRSPDAVVTFVPADHHVERETVMRRALARAASVVERGERAAALVGIVPEELDPDLGWIVTAPEVPGEIARAVSRFREKPERAEAARLLAAGAVVNTFLFAAEARALWNLCERLLPEIARPLAGAEAAAATTYAELPTRDFSKAILETSPESLAVVIAGACGWSDLGTPERVVRCLRRRATVLCPSPPAAVLDLSRQVSGLPNTRELRWLGPTAAPEKATNATA